ncbi:phenylalanine--tRNA ligase subunit beta [soil metagenome]
MRVPLSWLRELVPVDLTPDELAERLTLLGMEVSGITRLGSEWQKVVVGELTEVAAHPGSPRLSLTRVRVGDHEPELSIVCGATNIAPGQRVPVALPGAVLPGDRRIEVTRIAGSESQGMLCSGDELGLTSDADGILILPPDARIGLPLAELAGDVVLDVDVKPNRGDALSILGLAREVAAATGAPLGRPDLSLEERGDATADHLSVEVEDTRLCPRFVGRAIMGVTVGPSPWEVQRRLIAAGVRPLSNVVDASNYVMLELGKPVHVFDAAAIHEGRIIVRLARAGEQLETLDHVARELSPEDLLITDPRGPLAIAGVMGGASSEVSETSRDVIVESAIFDPVSVRRTAFRHALRSEASLRFEKGQEHGLARMGADRTAALITRWAGGRAAVGVVDTGPVAPPTVRIPFRPRRVNRLLGELIRAEDQRALLERVGVTTEPAAAGDRVPVIRDSGSDDLHVELHGSDLDEALVATIPPHRRDLRIEADLTEEIARIRGYETLPGRLPDTAMPGYRPDPRRLANDIRDLLRGIGLSEVVSHGLIGPEAHARMGWGVGDGRTIRATNPVTLDHSELRRSLLPGHLQILVDNERQRRADLQVFELGDIHAWRDGRADAREVLGLLLAGDEQPVTWDRPRRVVDTAHAKGILDTLAAVLLSARLDYRPTQPRDGVDHPGRTAAIVALGEDGAGHPIGRVGEVHPQLLRHFDVRNEHVVLAELDVATLAALAPEQHRVGRLDHVPDIERDLAIVVAIEQPAGEVETVIREQGGPSLVGVRLFDIYQGAPLDAGQKSLAYRLRFRPVDDRPGDDGLGSATENIVRELRERLGASLRA